MKKKKTKKTILYKLNNLCVFSSEGGPPVCLSHGLDREVYNLVWDNDSKAVYGLVPDKARVYVHRFTLEDKKIKRIITGERRLDQLCISKDNHFFPSP